MAKPVALFALALSLAGAGAAFAQPRNYSAFYNEPAEMTGYGGYGGYEESLDAPAPRGPDVRDQDLQLGRQYPTTTREVVPDPTRERAGTITVDTRHRHLYLSLGNGEAIRYGVGVGREGFTWKGRTHIGRMQEWPEWRPPKDMLKRRPDLPEYMEGGIDNPLGARAMYLYAGKRDTMFRIHGSNEPWTIGHAVSSGCIRMLNEDVTDLFSRVTVGTAVVVL
jgi:lipoprotein-anchoring transpeptidase ErfK/SrfK